MATNTPDVARTGKRTLSFRKRMAFSVVLLVLLGMLLELISFMGLRFSDGQWYSWSSARAERIQIAMSATPEQVTQAIDSSTGVVHPYLGYVMPPDWDPAEGNPKFAFTWSEDFTNRPCDGFPSRRPVVQKRSADKVLIGIFGGSVAEIFYHQGIPVLFERLKEDPAYHDKEFIVVCLATGGYKQPQHLMALNYLLTMGGELDLLINIDGFNEVAFHGEGNQQHGIYPVFPRAWNARVGQIRNHSVLKLYGRAAILESQLRDDAILFSQPPLSYSPTCYLVWRTRTRMLQKELREAKQAVEKSTLDDDSIRSGKGYHPASEEQMYDDLVNIWEHSSRQMRALCEGNGIRYFHFLQPNQYVEGSKTMNDDERKVAFNPDHVYRAGVIHGYPLLRKAGARLAAAGERFTDMTDAFATIKEPVYVDDCCHFSVAGNTVIANRIAQAILENVPDR